VGATSEIATAALADMPLGAVAPLSATPISAAQSRRIALYFAGLIVLLGFGENLLTLPLTFFLKNKLNLAAHQLAFFGLVANIPVYCAAAFGFVRDVVDPFGLGDRGFIILAGGAGALTCLGFAFVEPSYRVLLAAALALAVSLLFIKSGVRGLLGSVGQQNALTGQASSILTTFEATPVVAAFLVGGFLSDAMEHRAAVDGARLLFLAAAALFTLTALYGLAKPASVYAHVRRERIDGAHPLDGLRRLVRHTPVYPALLIWLLWQFVPGLGTPLQFFMQNTLRMKDSEFGTWWALFIAGGVPGFVLFGLLCRRFPLRSLLLWGTVAAIPMMLPLLFIRDAGGALVSAAPMGLAGSVAGAAYVDLIIRSCPPGLQGTVLMASAGLFSVDGQFGNVLGSALFERFHDFTVCVIAMTVTNLLILPALLLVPKRLVATADGESLAATDLS
jgi:hypothetical protein